MCLKNMQTMKPLLFNKMQTKNPKLIKMLLSEYGEEKSKCIIFEGVESQEAIFFFSYTNICVLRSLSRLG